MKRRSLLLAPLAMLGVKPSGPNGLTSLPLPSDPKPGGATVTVRANGDIVLGARDWRSRDGATWTKMSPGDSVIHAAGRLVL